MSEICLITTANALYFLSEIIDEKITDFKIDADTEWTTFGNKFKTRILSDKEREVAKNKLGDQFELFEKLYLPTTPDDERLKARNELAEKNRLLVSYTFWKICRNTQFANSKTLFQGDLEQVGNTGLLRALEDFNPGSGYRFSTYAYSWIMSYIKREIINNGPTIRIPVHVSDRLSKLKSVERELYKKLQRKPTEEEIIKKLNISLATLEELRKSSQKFFSLDTPNTTGKNKDEDGTFSLMDSIPAVEKPSTPKISGDKIFDIFKRAGLGENEILVLKYRFGLEGVDSETLESISNKLNLCRERIRQIESKAMRRLRHPSYSKLLEKLIG
jgi:RNA polymerase primary sigma factor